MVERTITATRSKNRKDKIRVNMFDIAGTCCIKCNNYQDDVKMLQLHHIDPSTKSFGLDQSNFKSRKWSLVSEEVKKCLSLCPNCHHEYHLKRWNYSELDINKLKDYQVELIKNYVSK